jgi:hypothetical protein
MMFFTSSEPEGSSTGRLLHIQIWYMLKLQYKRSKQKTFELLNYIDMNMKHGS